ncbi:hypothetical protein V2J09_003436 [Rumex salicifolius]
MTIYKHHGYPDLFVTFTCNPKWLEITRFVQERGLRPEDRPDIICRKLDLPHAHILLFLDKNSKLPTTSNIDKVISVEIPNPVDDPAFYAAVTDYMMHGPCGPSDDSSPCMADGKCKKFFPKQFVENTHIDNVGYPVYRRRNDGITIEKNSKLPTTSDIDKVISVEIPNPVDDPAFYVAVTDYMMDGPCGPLDDSSPCMADGKCKKFFPKQFVENTHIDNVGYPVYRRRDDKITIEKNGVALDKCYVVPYNAKLLMKFRAHINVEWCNRSGSIKYLFKYINKGSDRVTLGISSSTGNRNDDDVDEIKNYYNCRYLSACEAAWRIFGFDIHYMYQSVQRLSYHLPNEQNIYFDVVIQLMRC